MQSKVNWLCIYTMKGSAWFRYIMRKIYRKNGTVSSRINPPHRPHHHAIKAPSPSSSAVMLGVQRGNESKVSCCLIPARYFSISSPKLLLDLAFLSASNSTSLAGVALAASLGIPAHAVPHLTFPGIVRLRDRFRCGLGLSRRCCLS